MQGRIIDLSVSLDGKQRLMLELDGDFRDDFDALREHEVSITIKRFRKKRSLDANAYAWVLVDKIAEKMRLPRDDVYRSAIREIGGVSTLVCVQNKAVERLQSEWTAKGVGWQAETMPSRIPGCTTMTLYYGSSTYDTEQMSRLIDQLVETAKSLGIETEQPEKIKSLLEDYKNA